MSSVIFKMTQRTTEEILSKFYGSNVGAILVEGIPSEEYLSAVRYIQEHFSALEKPVSKDFLEMIAKDHEALFDEMLKVRNVRNWFVYNLDLFGEDIDPEKATEVMGGLRSTKNMNQQARQLMIARPNANLDYNSRKGFTYHDNHPLGNWCEFFRLEEGRLVRKQYPIEHR
jgi:hypothetical protein